MRFIERDTSKKPIHYEENPLNEGYSDEGKNDYQTWF